MRPLTVRFRAGLSRSSSPATTARWSGHCAASWPCWVATVAFAGRRRRCSGRGWAPSWCRRWRRASSRWRWNCPRARPCRAPTTVAADRAGAARPAGGGAGGRRDRHRARRPGRPGAAQGESRRDCRCAWPSTGAVAEGRALEGMRGVLGGASRRAHAACSGSRCSISARPWRSTSTARTSTTCRRPPTRWPSACARTPGLRDVRQSLVPGSPEVQVSLRPRQAEPARPAAWAPCPRPCAASCAAPWPRRYRDRERHVDIRVLNDPSSSATRSLPCEDLIVAERTVCPSGWRPWRHWVRPSGPAEIHRLGSKRVAIVTRQPRRARPRLGDAETCRNGCARPAPARRHHRGDGRPERGDGGLVPFPEAGGAAGRVPGLPGHGGAVRVVPVPADHHVHDAAGAQPAPCTACGCGG